MKGNELYSTVQDGQSCPYMVTSCEILCCYLQGLGSGILKTSDLTGAILVSSAKILLLRQEPETPENTWGLGWSLSMSHNTDFSF